MNLLPSAYIDGLNFNQIHNNKKKLFSKRKISDFHEQI